MALLTKNTKRPVREYHQWQPSDFSAGEILDVVGSLGGPATMVAIESIGGESVVRFNVVKKVHQNHGNHNSWMPEAGFYDAPLLLTEVEEATPDLHITSGSTQIWHRSEVVISDIKIITKASGLKITVS